MRCAKAIMMNYINLTPAFSFNTELQSLGKWRGIHFISGGKHICRVYKGETLQFNSAEIKPTPSQLTILF
jgi:hypothetical protein